MDEPNQPAPATVPTGAARGRHLDLDALNAYLDGALSPADREAAVAHLAGCAACAADLAELDATVALLRGLPQYRPRRSFTLGPEHAAARRPAALGGAWAPQALRTAALAVAALLVLAVVGEFAFARLTAPPPPPLAQPAATVPAAAKPAPAERDQEAFSAAETVPAAGEAAVAAPTAGGAAPVGTNARFRASEGVDAGVAAEAVRSGQSAWRLVQLGLGLLLLWLLVSLAGLAWVRRLHKGS